MYNKAVLAGLSATVAGELEALLSEAPVSKVEELSRRLSIARESQQEALQLLKSPVTNALTKPQSLLLPRVVVDSVRTLSGPCEASKSVDATRTHLERSIATLGATILLLDKVMGQKIKNDPFGRQRESTVSEERPDRARTPMEARRKLAHS
jgi:hypothetical protein